MTVFALIAAGAVSGLLMGMIGVGGDSLLMPLLLMLGIPLYSAVTIVLFLQVLPQSLPALWIYYKKGHFMLKESMMVLIGATVGTTLGAYLAVHQVIPKVVLYKLMSIVLIALGVYGWFAHPKSSDA